MYPILLEFGPITIFSLWFFIAAGFVIASFLFVHFAKRTRVRLTLLTDHSFALFFSTLAASRLAFILSHTDLFFYQWGWKHFGSLFAIWDKGLSFWGAVAGLFLGIFYFAKKNNAQSAQRTYSELKLFDLLIPSIFIGMFLGNIGAFLDGVNYGTPTDLPWGMTFRSANVKYISAIHPTQLYSALYSLGIGLGLLAILRRMRAAGIPMPGLLTELGLFSFSVFKFLEEFLRGDETLKIFSLRVPQLMAFFGIVAGGYLLYLRYTNRTGGDPQHVFKNTVTRIISRVRRKKQNSQERAEAHRIVQNPIG